MASIDIRLLTGDLARFPGGEAVGRFLLEGWYEAHEQAFVYQFLRPGGVFIDVGAHAGLYSVIAAAVVGDEGRVIAVEPNPHIAPFLERNLQAAHVADLASITPPRAIVAAALSDKAGEGAFSAGDMENSAYAALALAPEAAGDTSVTTMTLDALVKAAQLTQLDLIKIDVEGAEHLVLAGAAETVARFPDIVMMVEFTEENRARFGGSTAELFAAADALGLKVGRMDMTRAKLAPAERGREYWHENLIMARDLAQVEARLAGAGEGVRLVAADFARKGDMTRARYEESEALRTLMRAMAAPAAQIAQIRKALGAESGAPDRRLADAVAAGPPAAQAQRIVDWLADELARIEGDAAGVAAALDESRGHQHDALYANKLGFEALGRLIGAARDALTGEAEAEIVAGRVVEAFEAGAPDQALARVVGELMDQAGRLEGAARFVSQAGAADAETAHVNMIAARQEVRELGEAALMLRRSRVIRLASALRLRPGVLVEKMVRIYTAEEPETLQ